MRRLQTRSSRSRNSAFTSFQDFDHLGSHSSILTTVSAGRFDFLLGNGADPDTITPWQPDMVKTYKCTIKGAKFTIARDGKAVEEGTLKLDTTKKTKEIDMALGDGNQTALGIYELHGDTLKLCYAKPGNDRPKEFSAKEETGHTLSTWQRDKK